MHNPGEELVDVIDAEGRTVGVVTRQEMRARRLPHRCVYILVFNDKGELFVHLRTATKDVNPSHWDVAIGGVLAAGESFELGARRELCEELGLDELPPLEELFPFPYADERTVVRSMTYRVMHNGPFRLQPEEIVRGEFMQLEDVWQMIGQAPFCRDGVEVLNTYVRRLTGRPVDDT